MSTGVAAAACRRVAAVFQHAPAVMLDRLRGYRSKLAGSPVEASLLATVAYFLTLLVVRGYTTITKAGSGSDINIGGTHVHHVVFGIGALLIAGVLALDERNRLLRAVLFGFGAALVLDEFALVVFLKDVYWLPQGVVSGFAIVIGLVALAVNLLRSWAIVRASPR